LRSLSEASWCSAISWRSAAGLAAQPLPADHPPVVRSLLET
jgi:hypothetical protein